MFKQSSEYKSIQKKLVAAIAMVLVASLMVVSSSYAWFTLSTAPEVTGITTSVGSNGNLEMALRTGALADIENGIGLSGAAANETWGNLVDLSYNDVYGLDKLSLAPARLNTKSAVAYTERYTYTNVTVDKALKVNDPYSPQNNRTGEVVESLGTVTENTADGKTTYTYAEVKTKRDVYSYSLVTDSGYLRTPQYGTDGRVSAITANTVNGVYNAEKGAFNGLQNTTEFGVRGIGTVSNMTPEQLAMRDAKTAVRLAISNSKDAAIASLRTDAVAMANMIIQAKLVTNPQMDQDDVNALLAAIGRLKAVEVLLEDALKEAVVALGLANGQSFTKDKVTLYTGNTVGISVAVADADVNAWWAKASANAKADMEAAIAKLINMKSELTSAEAALASTEGTIAIRVNNALGYLLDANDIVLVNGSNTLGVNAIDPNNLGPVVDMVLDANTVITIESGIYATIAEFRGNYGAEKVDVQIDFTGTTYENMVKQMFNGNPVVTRQMNIATDVTTPANGFHLEYVKTWMEGLTVTGGTASTLITDYYGYVLDFAFRTNAKQSSLLLQTLPASRLNGNEAAGVQGAGSYMKFKPESADYTNAQMIELMKAIRVVFTNDRGEIYGVAALDMYDLVEFTNQQFDVKVKAGDTVTIGEKTYVVDSVGTEAEVKTDDTVTGYSYDKIVVQDAHYTVGNDGYITAYLYMYSFSVDTEGVMTLGQKLSTGTITELQQNVAQEVSTLVYLDGDYVENGDVAISGNSMTGQMNLQFASSADLIPMDYTFESQEKLAAPTAQWDSAKGELTITPATGAPTGVKYDIFVSPDNGTTLIPVVADKDAGTYTVDMSGVTTAGTYQIYVVATMSGYTDSNAVAVTNGTFTIS